MCVAKGGAVRWYQDRYGKWVAGQGAGDVPGSRRGKDCLVLGAEWDERFGPVNGVDWSESEEMWWNCCSSSTMHDGPRPGGAMAVYEPRRAANAN